MIRGNRDDKQVSEPSSRHEMETLASSSANLKRFRSLTPQQTFLGPVLLMADAFSDPFSSNQPELSPGVEGHSSRRLQCNTSGSLCFAEVTMPTGKRVNPSSASLNFQGFWLRFYLSYGKCICNPRNQTFQRLCVLAELPKQGSSGDF